VAAFAAIAEKAVLADCDVDAADLPLILVPRVRQRHQFRSARQAITRRADCTGCCRCLELCRFDAVCETADGKYTLEPTAWEGRGVCVRFCPAGTTWNASWAWPATSASPRPSA